MTDKDYQRAKEYGCELKYYPVRYNRGECCKCVLCVEYDDLPRGTENDKIHNLEDTQNEYCLKEQVKLDDEQKWPSDHVCGSGKMNCIDMFRFPKPSPKTPSMKLKMTTKGVTHKVVPLNTTAPKRYTEALFVPVTTPDADFQRNRTTTNNDVIVPPNDDFPMLPLIIMSTVLIFALVAIMTAIYFYCNSQNRSSQRSSPVEGAGSTTKPDCKDNSACEPAEEHVSSLLQGVVCTTPVTTTVTETKLSKDRVKSVNSSKYHSSSVPSSFPASFPFSSGIDCRSVSLTDSEESPTSDSTFTNGSKSSSDVCTEQKNVYNIASKVKYGSTPQDLGAIQPLSPLTTATILSLPVQYEHSTQGVYSNCNTTELFESGGAGESVSSKTVPLENSTTNQQLPHCNEDDDVIQPPTDCNETEETVEDKAIDSGDDEVLRSTIPLLVHAEEQPNIRPEFEEFYKESAQSNFL